MVFRAIQPAGGLHDWEKRTGCAAVAYTRRVFSYTQTTPSPGVKHERFLVGSAAVREPEFFV